MSKVRKICTILLLTLIVSLSGRIALAVDDGRTVVDNCRGGVYMLPLGWDFNAPLDDATNCGRFAQLGAYYGANLTDTTPIWRWFYYMDPYALKGVQGRLHCFGDDTPTDGTSPDFYSFPYDLCKSWEADEVSKGRSKVFPTATGYLSSRPVYNAALRYGFNVNANMVNLGDWRFVNFFIHDYEREQMMRHGCPPGNIEGIDSCFDWAYQTGNCSYYWGVFDNQIPSVFQYLNTEGITSLDQPFPQNDAQCYSNAAFAINSVATYAPDIRLIANTPTLGDITSDWTTWDNMFSNLYGFLFEDLATSSRTNFYYTGQNNFYLCRYYCQKFYNNFYQVATRSNMVNKVQFYDCNFATNQDGSIDSGHVRDAYIAHLIMGGPNRFFAPRDRSSVEIDPANYAAMKNALGEPYGSPIADTMDGGAGFEWMLRRQMYGGWAYFNCSTAYHTVTLPAGTWYNSAGQQVTQLTLAPGEGNYVQLVVVPVVGKVMINPRRPMQITGNLQVTLGTAPWTSGAEIRYTTNGSTPSRSSTLYTGPFTLTGTGVKTVKAIGYKSGSCDGPVSTAQYNLTSALPTVGFHLNSDEMSDYLHYLPLIRLSRPSTSTVTVHFQVTPGTGMVQGTNFDVYDCDNPSTKLSTGQTGTATFAPGEEYKHFLVVVYYWTLTPSPTDKTIYFSVTNPTNAVLGNASASPYIGFTDMVKTN